MIKNLIALIAIAFLCSCGNDGMGEFDNINNADAIKGMFNKQAEQAKKEGMTSKLKYDAHALEGFWILDGNLIEDDSLKSIYTNWDKHNKIVDYKLESVQVFPINTTNAAYHYQAEIIFTDSTKTEKTLKQLESGVVTKVAEKWLYLNGNTTNITSRLN